MEPGDWKCVCGSINFKRRNDCRGCARTKPTNLSVIKPGDKICRQCNEVNFASRFVCRKCNTVLTDSTPNTGTREHQSSEQKSSRNQLDLNANNGAATPLRIFNQVESRNGDWYCLNNG